MMHFIYIMSQIDGHLDTIVQSMVENYPAEAADEVEFSIWGQPNRDGSPWNLGISNFRSILTDMSKALKIELPEAEIMLTVQPKKQGKGRMRIHDMDSIQTFCRTNSLPPDDKGMVFESKQRLNKVDLGYGIRLRYSSEKVIKDQDTKTELLKTFADASAIKVYRYAKRYTLKYPVKIGKSGSIKLDFTVLRQGTGRDFRAAKLIGNTANRTPETYEVEIELVDLTQEELADPEVHRHIKTVLRALLLKLNGGITVVSEEEQLVKIQDYVKLCKDVFPRLPDNAVETLGQDTMRDIAPYNMAVYITTLDRTVLISQKMLNTPYMYTDKADGLRALMHVNSDGLCNLIVKETVNMLKYDKDHLTRQQILTFDKQPATTLRLIPTDMTLEEFTMKEVVKQGDKKGVKKTQVNFNNSVFDGELLHINGVFYFKTFDLLIHQGESLMKKDFTERLKLFSLVEQDNGGNFYVSPKDFGSYEGDLSKFGEYVESLVIESDGREVKGIKIKDKGVTYELDGLVFQPASGEMSYYPEPRGGNPSTWFNVFKWKPLHHLTIDLKLDYKGNAKPPIITKRERTIQAMETEETEFRYAQYKAYSGNSKGELFISEYPCNVLLETEDSIPRTEEGEPIVKGNVVECRLSLTDGYHWVPVRIRHDKSKPNSLKVYESTLYSITDEPITLDNLRSVDGGFGGHSKLVVTKLNRSASNEHITKWGLKIKGDIVLLDLASGNAKSSRAWRDISRSSLDKDIAVLGIDIEDVQKAYSIMNADFNKDKRSNEMYVKNFDFVVGDFLQPLHLNRSLSHLKTPERFNMVSCIFAIHYAMRSKKDFRMFLANVTRNLKNGGIFVGSYMNRRKVMDLFHTLETSGAGSAKLSRDKTYMYTETSDKSRDTIWKIEKGFKDEPGLFENNSILVDFMGLYKGHLEYLIDLEDSEVQDIMKEYGLELEEHISFNEVISRQQKDNKFIKEKYSEATLEELVWMDFHYNFTFRKTKSLPAYADLFQDDGAKPKAAAKIPVLKPTKLSASGKTKVSVVAKKPVKPVKKVQPTKPTVKAVKAKKK